MRRRISSGTDYEKRVGYSRALVAGDWVFVSGTVGRDMTTGEVPEDAATQVHNCFKTINWALKEAGSSFADVVRARVIMTDPGDEAAMLPVFKEYFGPVGPALTICVARLLDPRLKIEIDVTALKSK